MPTASAALLSRHVFVDLETTGLDPSRDEVIEVGALFVDGGKVVRRIARLFRPSFPLPADIRRLTGIRESDLAKKPPFRTFLPELKVALTGWTVVAHNAAFERSFLNGLLTEIRAPVLDSCELLHYLYPELESHSLDAMVRWAGVAKRATHRAAQDCADTLAVVTWALDRCIDERRTEDLDELLGALAPPTALSKRAPEAPLLALLKGLRKACGTPPRRRRRPESAPYLELDERASRAYLGAWLRRAPEPAPERLSRWFRERYPLVETLAPAALNLVATEGGLRASSAPG